MGRLIQCFEITIFMIFYQGLEGVFHVNKKKKIEEIVLVNLYELILDSTLKKEERNILIIGKNRIEKNEYFPKVMNDLEYELRPFAIRSELSDPVAKFYMDISDKGKFEKELGRGIASTAITFGK